MSIQHEKTLAELFNDLIPQGGWVWQNTRNGDRIKKLQVTGRFFFWTAPKGLVTFDNIYGFVEQDYHYNLANPIPENELIRARESTPLPDPSEVQILKARVEDLKDQISDALNEIAELRKYKEAYEKTDALWKEQIGWNELLVQQCDRLLTEKEALTSLIALLGKK